MKAIALALIVSIATLQCPAYGQDAPPENQEDVTACGPGCVLGLLAVGIGIVVTAALVSFCKKHLPRDNPPPPPRHNSDGDTDTNTIPPIIILPPLLPVLTMTSFTDGAIDYSDISTNGWTDGQGNLFALYFEATLLCSTNLPNWDQEIPLHVYLGFATVNGVPDYTRQTNSVVIGFDRQGQPMFTNYNGAVSRLAGEYDRQFFKLRVP